MKKENKKKIITIFEEFKKFITKGNVIDMAIGVIMGSSFGAIVNAVVQIFLSICTWGVPGGISGLVTVLPAITDAQKGLNGIGQFFDKNQLNEMTQIYASNSSLPLDDTNSFYTAQSNLLKSYTLHGNRYYYNSSAIIDWGTLINAAISFLIIALVLFLILKIFNYLHNKRLKLEEIEKEKYYSKHPEERPKEENCNTSESEEVKILKEIRDELKKENK